MTASGYAAVWATDNTRAAIFDALHAQGSLRHDRPAHDRALLRRLRLQPADAKTRNPAGVGYAKGVPMGGDLTAAPAGKAPTFLVAALKDPIGANLDRIQIVKGWQDASGALQDKVYDVVWGDAANPQAGRERQAAARRQHGRRAPTPPGPTPSAIPS